MFEVLWHFGFRDFPLLSFAFLDLIIQQIFACMIVFFAPISAQDIIIT